MLETIELGRRRSQAMSYSDAINDDAWAIELAEVVDEEVGPALLTALFPCDDGAAEPRVLMTDGSLPLAVPSVSGSDETPGDDVP